MLHTNTTLQEFGCSILCLLTILKRFVYLKQFRKIPTMNIDLKCVSFVILLTIFVLAQQGDGLKCWDCRSDHDPKCADPFDNATFAITDCEPKRLEFFPDAKAKMCRKIRQKVNGVWLYKRGCAWFGEPGIEGDERFCLLRTGTYNIFMEYCTCNSKDGCNVANSLRISTAAMMISVGVTVLFRIIIT